MIREFQFIKSRGKSLTWFARQYGYSANSIHHIARGRDVLSKRMGAALKRCEENFKLQDQNEKLKRAIWSLTS